MATLGTFDSFTTARLGIYAAQHGLHITGNNISNINTIGYTRQRVDQVSFKTGSTDRYASWADNHMGSGVLVSGISQIRDPFLDIRYRTTATDTYYYDSKLSGLQNIAAILDEVARGDNDGDGMIYAQLQDMLTQLRGFSANPTSANDTLVRNSAESLASLFRFYAGKLDELYANTQTDFNKNITKVNEILTNIRDLNESIREAEIHGDRALESRDERNRQIDELAKYMSIRVEYSYEDVGAGIQVEKLTIKMGNSNPDKNVHTDESILVDGLYATQLSVPEEKPVLNTYADETLYGQYSWYMKDYMYMRVVADDGGEGTEALDQFMSTHGLMFDDLIPAGKDDNGNTLYIIGTNDAAADGIVTEENDNYTVQLGQLLDRKGNAWENTETTWTTVSWDDVLASKPKFAFPISVDFDENNNTFGIGNVEYVINFTDGTVTANGTLIPDVNLFAEDGSGEVDPVKFAEFVAQKLSAIEPPIREGYTVSAENGQIVFTLDPNADPPPAGPPDPLSVNDPDNVKSITIGKMKTYLDTAVDEYGNTTNVSYVKSGDQWYKVTIETEYTREIALDDNDLHGILQAQREMLSEEGEFASAKDVSIDENACIKRGLPYYIKSLDLLAQKFAQAYNELNDGYMTDKDGYYITENGERIQIPDLNGDLQDVNSETELTDGQRQYLINNGYILHDENGYAVDKNGNLIRDRDGDPIQVAEKNGDGTFTPITPPDVSPEDQDKLVVDLKKWLGENGGVHMGGPLFSNSNAGNDTSGINAHNIDISAGWSNGAWGIVPKFETLYIDENDPDGMEHSTQNKNADHMVSLLLDKMLTYDPRDLLGSDAIGPVLFEGTFNDMLSNMMGVEASDERITRVNLTTSDLMLTELDYNREGVSGVDLNDEAMNMISYQKAMNAAMRLMTAIDEALDRLINNTGIAGR